MKTLILMILALGATQAQTVTYTIPDSSMPNGDVCNGGGGIESCYYHNLTAMAADGTTLWGLFEAGGYWTQFQYQAFQGQNPGYAALYCSGSPVWTTAAMDNGDTFYTMDCSAPPSGQVGPATLHAEIEAHSVVISYVCGVKIRTICRRTQWIVDAGTLAITPITTSAGVSTQSSTVAILD